MERQDGSTDGTDPNGQQDPYGQPYGQQGEQGGQPFGQSSGAWGQGYGAQQGVGDGSQPSWGGDASASSGYPASDGGYPGSGSPSSCPSSGGSAPQAPQYGDPQYGTPQGGDPQYGAPQYGSPSPQGPEFGTGGSQAPDYGSGAYPAAGSPSSGQAPIAGGPGDGGPKKSKLGWILGGVGGCLVLLLIVVLIIVFAVRSGGGGGEESGGGGGGGDTSTAADLPPEEAIPAAATAYLQAIADADAETAFSYLDPDYGTTQSILMTDDALAASAEQAPITGIEATLSGDSVGDAGYGDASVSYVIGETEVSETWSFFEADDGSWKLYGGTGSLYLDSLAGLGATVNGVAIEDETDIEVFPGSYTVAIDQQYLDLDGEATALISAPSQSGDFYELEAVLNDEGTEYARGLVQDAVNACLEETTRDSGCGLSIPETLSDGTEIAEDTVERSLPDTTQATLDELEFTTEYDEPTTVTSESIGSVDITAECTQGDQSGRCEILMGPSLGTATIDLAAEEPEVLWD